MIKPAKLVCKTECFYCPSVEMKFESWMKRVPCDKQRIVWDFKIFTRVTHCSINVNYNELYFQWRNGNIFTVRILKNFLSYLFSLKIYFLVIVQETDKLTHRHFACIVIQASSSLRRKISIRNYHQPNYIPEFWQSSGGSEETLLGISEDECDSRNTVVLSQRNCLDICSFVVLSLFSSTQVSQMDKLNGIASCLITNEKVGRYFSVMLVVGWLQKNEFTLPVISSSLEKFEEHYLLIYFSLTANKPFATDTPILPPKHPSK